MRSLDIAWNAISVATLAVFTWISVKKKTRLSPIVATLCALAGMCVLSYTTLLFVPNKRAALTLFSIYYICDMGVLGVIYIFAISIAEISKRNSTKSVGARVFYIFAGLISLALIANIWTESVIGIEPVLFKNGWLNYWKQNYTWQSYIFVGFQTVMVCVILATLLKRAFKLPTFYKSKFITLASSFALVATVNSSALFFSFKYELSITLYVFLAAYAFQISFWGINESLLNTMISLVSENIRYAVVCFASRGRCFYLNREARNIFGYGNSGLAAAEGYRDKLLSQYPEKMFGFLTLTQSLQVNSVTRTFDCEYKILKDKKNRNVVSYLKLVDTTQELKRLEEEKIRSERDPLTGLYNRSTFFKRAAEILRANRSDDFYLIATNIMDFKIVNSLFGEPVGDDVLKLQAALLSSTASPNAAFGRLTADKFAALLPKELFDMETIRKNNETLRQSLAKYNYKLQNYTGVYEIADKYENVKTMYDKAAMTIEDIRGNMETVAAFYDSSIMDRQIRDKRIVSEFDDALENGQFVMYLQPQINASDERIVGAEALVRWITPDRGTVAPMDFIPVLEKSGLIHKLDQYMWEEAAKKLAEWKARAIDMYISINISAKDFYYCDIYKFFTELVERYDISPKNLKIEITETVLMQDMNAHGSVLQKLSDYGFTIEMDDFGSGYSSLNTLKNVEMNTLKIDMGFLRASNFSQKVKDIISSIISMSKTLGMTVVTEGVETEDQVKFLRQASCDIFQGFYFSKPLSIGEFEKKYCDGGTK